MQRNRRVRDTRVGLVFYWAGIVTFPSFSAFSSSSGVRSGRIASATIRGKNVSAALTTWIYKQTRKRNKGSSNANS